MPLARTSKGKISDILSTPGELDIDWLRMLAIQKSLLDMSCRSLDHDYPLLEPLGKYVMLDVELAVFNGDLLKAVEAPVYLPNEDLATEIESYHYRLGKTLQNDTLEGFTGVLRFISDPKQQINFRRLSEISDALYSKIERLAKDPIPFSAPEEPLILVGAELVICSYSLLCLGDRKWAEEMEQYALHDGIISLHEALADAIEVRNNRLYL